MRLLVFALSFGMLLACAHAPARGEGAARSDANPPGGADPAALCQLHSAWHDPTQSPHDGASLRALELRWSEAERGVVDAFATRDDPLTPSSAETYRDALAEFVYAEPAVMQVGVEGFYAADALAESALTLAARLDDAAAARRWLARVDPYRSSACADAWRARFEGAP